MADNQNKVAPAFYTPPGQEALPEEERARYKVRGLKGVEVMDVNFVTDELTGVATMTSRGAAACLRAGLLGWENVRDADGKPVEFVEGDWKKNSEAIPGVHLIGVAWDIWNRSNLFPAERKN